MCIRDRRRHLDKIKQGMKLEDIDPGSDSFALKAQVISDADAEAELDRIFEAMGIVSDSKQGKKKVRTRKRTRKPTRPVGERTDEEWEQFKDREPGEETYSQETMVGVDLNDPVDVAKIGRIAKSVGSTAFDMAFEYWINGILSGPQTHMVNIAGTVANAGWDMTVQRGMEAMINTVLRKESGAQAGEFKYLIKGIMPGISRGMRIAMKLSLIHI